MFCGSVLPADAVTALMTERDVQVMYRSGRMLAASLHLAPPAGQMASRTEDGLLIVDFGCEAQPIDIEVSAPQAVHLERLIQPLAELGERPLAAQDYRPVRAA